jgi:alpha-glucosidase (family GH31 glycosyl hydrolase)
MPPSSPPFPALQVWPGASHYPDFLSPASRRYFAGQLRQHHALVPWDGIW